MNAIDTSAEAAAAAWDEEYRRAGIPSSHREEPSGVVRWALTNLPFLGMDGGTALDVGCGKGRNTRAVAAAGFQATGIDYSQEAISFATSVSDGPWPKYVLQDMTGPLPFKDASVDLVLDIFVYFHNLNYAARRAYRQELRRVMSPQGVLVVSLATAGDGYYSACPNIEDSRSVSPIPLKWDPEAAVGNMLPTEAELLNEMSDQFQTEMTWKKRKAGPMHGGTYVRETLAAIFRPGGTS